RCAGGDAQTRRLLRPAAGAGDQRRGRQRRHPRSVFRGRQPRSRVQVPGEPMKPAIATAHGAPFQDAPLAAGRGFDLAALWALFVTKFAATVLVTSALVGLFTGLTLVVIHWNSPDLWSEVLPERVPKTAALMALAQVGYCAFFGTLSLLTRRSVLGGLAYIL